MPRRYMMQVDTRGDTRSGDRPNGTPLPVAIRPGGVTGRGDAPPPRRTRRLPQRDDGTEQGCRVADDGACARRHPGNRDWQKKAAVPNRRKEAGHDDESRQKSKAAQARPTTGGEHSGRTGKKIDIRRSVTTSRLVRAVVVASRRQRPPRHTEAVEPQPSKGTVSGCPGCTAPSTPFNSRIRSTTAEASDRGATRPASSHRLSPGCTRTTVVRAGSDGSTADDRAPSPYTAAHATDATASTHTADNRGLRGAHVATTRDTPAAGARRRVGGRCTGPRRATRTGAGRSTRGAGTCASTSDLCAATLMTVS